VSGWGQNDSGQLATAGLSEITAVSAGLSHSMALREDGTVVAFGSDTFGQSTVPAGLPEVTAISAGLQFSLVLLGDGTVTGWGDNVGGQVVTSVLDGAIAISAGFNHVLALIGPVVLDTCSQNVPGQLVNRLIVLNYPRDDSLSGYLITRTFDGTTTVEDGFRIDTDSSGTGTSPVLQYPETGSQYTRRLAIYRDTNGSGRWDEGDETLFQGTATLPANDCVDVAYAPK